MAKGKKTGGRDFPKGHKFGKGRPKIPEEVKKARELNKAQASLILNKYFWQSEAELKKVMNDPKVSIGEKGIVAILMKAKKDGDQHKMEWLFQRLIGKVPDESKHGLMDGHTQLLDLLDKM